MAENHWNSGEIRGTGVIAPVAIEGAKYSPSLELAFRIAAVFRKPLEEVFQYDNGRSVESD
jgi:DNA-binding XRE family transcriptional regulator